MPKVTDIRCHKIINSRGDWTIETHVELDDGSLGVQAIPDGASKGENEAIYVAVEKAVHLVEGPIKDLVDDIDAYDQAAIDRAMNEMDGTSNKSHLGGNSILSVSLAVAKACAVSKKVELYEYLADLYGAKLQTHKKLPTPLFNVLNGGKHASNNLAFQEFMLIPSPAYDFAQALDIGVAVYHTLEKQLEEQGYETGVGDEGGFEPENLTVPKALRLLKEAASKNYAVGQDVFFGLDVAAESFWKSTHYEIPEENLKLTTAQLADYYGKLLKDYAIILLEDPFYEKDVDGWQDFCTKSGSKLMVVADDLVVTNAKFLQKAIESKLANAVIVKPNQVGTLTETFDFIKMARKANMSVIVSHRSGDVAEDTFIADLAVAVEADFIKSGAPARGERVAKYNRLLEILGN